MGLKITSGIAALTTLLTTGCSSITTTTEHGRIYIKHDDYKSFAITNDRNPRVPLAIVVRRHETRLVLKLKFF